LACFNILFIRQQAASHIKQKDLKMTDLPPSIVSHISLGTNRYQEALDFYDGVLAAIGAKRILELHQHNATAYGRQFPEFWIQAPHDQSKATVGNGTHVAFLAISKQAVVDFFEAAVKAGGSPDGEPGDRPHYGKAYYGCFVRDLDGNKIEAMYWDETLGEEGH
jgi:catechol 2,3-dioxygenase-like lactoylglutathione lyase family enzyme